MYYCKITSIQEINDQKTEIFLCSNSADFYDSMISIVICGVVDFGASLDNLNFVVRFALSNEQITRNFSNIE